MWISPAYASAAAAAAPSAAEAFMMNMGLILVLVILFYLLLIRPQQKRFRDHTDLLSALRKGDKVVLQSGVIATIDKLSSDAEVTLEIAPGVKVQAYKSSISGKYTPETHANENAKDAA